MFGVVVVTVAKVHAWMQHQPIEQVIVMISLFINLMLVLYVELCCDRYLGKYHKKVCLSLNHFSQTYIQPRLIVEAIPSVLHCRVVISVSRSSCC